MPIQYKVPAYIGNALLLLLGIIVLFSQNVITGLLLGALAGLNLFLVYKLDQFSRDEVWLAHELEMTKMREELLAAQKHIEQLEGGRPSPGGTAAPGTAGA
jgi:hypothetical protein